jgi:FAD/FMN-containing dehydrogenase
MKPELVDRFAAIVGPGNALQATEDKARYLLEPRDLYRGVASLVLRPGNTAEVARIMRLASESRTAVVPQSGNTGLVGGQIACEADNAIVVSLERMDHVLATDVSNNTMTVEAGVILKDVQEAAERADRLFPLSLASEGSCRIGGNLASNAGGLNVLAYGNARDLCLGLEVVLPDGRVWNGLRALRKDNTGYDLKNLFIGSEGTLGIITAAVLKLHPRPRTYETAFIAVPSPAAALELLALARSLSGNRIVAFELMSRLAVELAVKHMAAVDPLASSSPWYVLLEHTDCEDGAMLRLLEDASTKELVSDAAIAQSEAQRQALWHVREALSESQKPEGGSIKHDISVPVSRIPAFIDEATAAVQRFMPNARPVPFGHMGDGNLHFNISQPIGADKARFLATWEAMNDVVYAVVQKNEGSISAEHGIGRLKRERMSSIKSPVELEMMRGLKALFDPLGIMNPGKTIP